MRVECFNQSVYISRKCMNFNMKKTTFTNKHCQAKIKICVFPFTSLNKQSWQVQIYFYFTICFYIETIMTIICLWEGHSDFKEHIEKLQKKISRLILSLKNREGRVIRNTHIFYLTLVLKNHQYLQKKIYVITLFVSCSAY